MAIYIPVDNLKKKINNRINRRLCSIELNQTVLPPYFSLQEYINFVYDQGKLGSCTSNAFCAAYKILNNIHNNNNDFEPSRLFFYYQEREIEGNINIDIGADVIDGEQYVCNNGICNESLWPYDINKFNIKPTPNCYDDAQNHKITNCFNIPIDNNLLDKIKYYIFNKTPVLIALAIYSSFESPEVASSGLIPMPNKSDEILIGGHELLIIGYNDPTQNFIVLNSWGKYWGINGYCYIPYTYFLDPDLIIEANVFTL